MNKIGWDACKEASAKLIAEAAPYSAETERQMGERQGVYAMVYCGTQLGGNLWEAPEPRIVYIGHAGDDSPRHWQNDTAVSTIRRSLAAMLATSLNLHAVPGSLDPADADRFSNYRLDEASELLLTNWMRENLRVAFLDLSVEETEAWYLGLVDYNAPMFVFQNNPNNSYGAQIKLYRSRLAEEAAHA